MKRAFIIDGIRSPIGNLGGGLSRVRPDDLAGQVIAELFRRTPSVPQDKIDEVIFGCANQAGEDNRNVARMALLLGGLPPTVPGITVNRLCASGLSSVIYGAHQIAVGEGEFVVAGGVESMSRAPFVLSKADSAFGRSQEFFDTTLGWRFINSKMRELYGVDSMGETAENVAAAFKIDRASQDKFALHSQHKAASAREKGRFKSEILPISIPQGKGDPIRFEHDEFIKPDTTIEKLSKLKPAFNKGAEGSVTAGNSSGLNDGACALLLASEEAVKKYSLKPLARVLSSASVGVEPCIMGVGPIEASKKAVQRAGISLNEIDLIELNEAFASQSLACLRGLEIDEEDPRVNPNGGAIALGHPLGMSGARLALTAARELELKKARYALCTMCVGVGQGVALVIERA